MDIAAFDSYPSSNHSSSSQRRWTPTAWFTYSPTTIPYATAYPPVCRIADGTPISIAAMRSMSVGGPPKR